MVEESKGENMDDQEFPYKLNEEEINVIDGLIAELNPLVEETQLDTFFNNNIKDVIFYYSCKKKEELSLEISTQIRYTMKKRLDNKLVLLTLNNQTELNQKKALIPFILKELISKFFISSYFLFDLLGSFSTMALFFRRIIVSRGYLFFHFQD